MEPAETDPIHTIGATTPTLRNVELTAPHMRNGGMSTLAEVIEFYNRGGVANELLSPLMQNAVPDSWCA